MERKYRLSGIDCAVCAQNIEKAIQKSPVIESAVYNFASERLLVTYTAEYKEVYADLIQIIKRNEPEAMLSDVTAEDAEISRLKQVFTPQTLIKIFGAVLFFTALILEQFIENRYLMPVLSVAAYLLIAYDVLYRFFVNLFRLKIFDENFLMTVATAGAFALQYYEEAVAIMLFYQFGELFQRLAISRSRNSIRRLISGQKDHVTVISEGKTARVEPEIVKIGDKMLIRAGERIPLDGVITEGASTVDTSLLTGESMPRSVDIGDDILSGTVNLSNTLTADVTKIYAECTQTKILDMVENASSKKAGSEQFITKFSKYYTPAMVGIAFIVGIVVPVLFSLSIAEYLRHALIFLLISCPCALVLSIPMCYFGGIGAASRRGILFKGSNYLDALSKLETIVFDKTGTITSGVFSVTDVQPIDGVSRAALLELAAKAESFSTHPLARAVLKEYGQAVDTGNVTEHKDYVGLGIEAVIGGRTLVAGSKKLLANFDIPIPSIHGNTVIYLALDGRYIGAIHFEDTIKQGVRETISRLKELGVKKTVMLTGDIPEVAETVASSVGFDEYRASCMPTDKLDYITALSGKRAAFVGEGINDVLAISAADVGISMGALGSDAAMEAADVVLMTDEPSKIPVSISIARRTRQLAIFNIILVLLVKAAVMVVSFLVQDFPLWLAEVADVGIALVAVGIAMTILRYNPEKALTAASTSLAAAECACAKDTGHKHNSSDECGCNGHTHNVKCDIKSRQPRHDHKHGHNGCDCKHGH